MTETLDEPLGVIARDELGDEPLCLGERLEPMEIEALLLQRPHEALDHPVALRLPHERRRVLDAEPPQLRAEGVGRVRAEAAEMSRRRSPIVGKRYPLRTVCDV